MNYFSKNLKLLRGSKSQEVFGKELGISQGNIGAYERGETMPGLQFLLKLVEQYDVSLDWLVCNKEAISSDNLDKINLLQSQLEEERILNRRLTNQLLDLTEIKKEEKTG